MSTAAAARHTASNRSQLWPRADSVLEAGLEAWTDGCNASHLEQIHVHTPQGAIP